MNKLNDSEHLINHKNIIKNNLNKIKVLILIKILKMNSNNNQITFNKQNNHTKKNKVYTEPKIKSTFLNKITIKKKVLKICK
jgi:hypothetical protein